jgi:hypothetical protein
MQNLLQTLPIIGPGVHLPSPAYPLTGTDPTTAPAVSLLPKPAAAGPAFQDRQFTLPNGQPLLLTAGRETLMHQVFGGDTQWLVFPTEIHELLLLLWLCAPHPQPKPWLAMGRNEEGHLMPLYLRIHALNSVVMDWVDTVCSPRELAAVCETAINLWVYHHATDVVPDPTADGGEPEKKSEAAATLQPLSNSSGSSAEGTLPDGNTYSGACLSGTPLPRATAV